MSLHQFSHYQVPFIGAGDKTGLPAIRRYHIWRNLIVIYLSAILTASFKREKKGSVFGGGQRGGGEQGTRSWSLTPFPSPNLKIMNYQEYLKSDLWKRTKERFFNKHKSLKRQKKKYGHYLCMNLGCRSSKNLNVHHKNYHRLGKEYLSDLILLCEDCHHKLHKYSNDNLSIHKNTYNFLRKGWKKSKGHYLMLKKLAKKSN